MDGGFLYAIVVGVCAGVASVLIFGFGILSVYIVLAAAIVAIVAGVLARQKIILFIAFSLCAAALGLVRAELFVASEAAETLVRSIGANVTVRGVVSNDPDKRATSLHINIDVASVDGEKASGTLLAILPRDSALSYGDTVEVSGMVSAPQPFETDTGRMFDYASYLRVQGVSAMMSQATLVQVTPGPWSLQKSLFSTKHIFESSLERLFPEPDNSLLEGVLLGERRGLPQDINDAFISSGLVHVVVLSGYNISIVANAVLYITSVLPRTMSYGVSGVLMILFALMTGAGATTVRACLMGLISILAQYLRRPTLALRSLAAAAGAMVVWNPLALLYDPSFILSVLATFGLITISPMVETYLTFLPERFGVRSIAAATISVQIFVLPALLYFTGVLSFMALPANILALPVVPFAMLTGFLAGVLGLIHPALGVPFMIVSDLLLRWMILVATTEHSLPFSSTIVSAFSAWVVAGLYVPLTAFAIYLYRRALATNRKWQVID